MLALVCLLLVSIRLSGVELGHSRRAVIAELGHPRGTMVVGEKEVLDYGTGKVVLVDGLVDRVYGTLTAGTPQPPPRAEGTRPAPKVEAPVTPTATRSGAHALWLTDLNQAKQRAATDGKLILMLFTGTDWCPPCQQFQREVADDEQFGSIFSPSFVFVKADWLRNTPMPAAQTKAVQNLIDTYQVNRFPTLKVLNAEGEVLADVDWTSVKGGSFKEILIEAIDDARKATKDGKKASRGWWPW